MRIAGDGEECGIRRIQYTDVKNAKEVFRLECAIIAVRSGRSTWRDASVISASTLTVFDGNGTVVTRVFALNSQFAVDVDFASRHCKGAYLE